MPSKTTKQLIRLGKDTFFYGMGSALQKFIGFFLFPIYTRVLVKEEYGVQDLVFSAVTIISYFLILGLDSGTARHYYDAKDSEDQRKILSSYLWFEIALSLPVSALLIFFSQPICHWIFNDSSLAPYFQWAMASLPFTLIAGVTLLSLRLNFKSKLFAIIMATGVLVQAIVSIYMVVVLEMGVMGIFQASLIASIFRAVIGIVFTLRDFDFSISLFWLKPMLSFGVPLVPASLSLWVLNYANRYFLVRLGTLDDIALLSVGSRVASIIVFVISAFRIAWGPFAYSLISDEKLAKKTYSRVLTYFLILTLVATVSLSVFAKEAIALLATKAYLASAPVVPFLAISAIAWGSVYIVGIGYGIAKKSYHTTIATVLAALINTGLNFVLIPRWGILGAASATMIGNIAALIYVYTASQRYFSISYEFPRLSTLIALGFATIAGCVWLDLSLTVWSPWIFLFKITIYMAFLISLLFLKVVRSEEIVWARTRIGRKISQLSEKQP